MDIANYISVKYGYMTNEDRYEIREMLKDIWSGYSIDDIKLEQMETALQKDKKMKMIC